MKKGFTLIELLVVISIIALLSSIVLAATNTARQKARLNAGKQFESTVNNVEGDQVVTQIDFNECSGLSAVDSSGSGRNGTLSSSVSAWSTDTPTGTGCSYNSASGRYVQIPPSTGVSSYANPVTVSMWLKESSYVSREVMVGNVESPSAATGYFVGQGYTGADGAPIFEVNGGGVQYFITSPNKIPLNEWVNLVAIYDGSKVSLYMNGLLIASGTFTGGVGNNVQSTYIGQATQGGWDYYTGLIDNVRIYAKSLTAMEVRDSYLAERAYYLASNK